MIFGFALQPCSLPQAEEPDAGRFTLIVYIILYCSIEHMILYNTVYV